MQSQDSRRDRMSAPNEGNGDRDRQQFLLRQAAEAVVGSVQSSRASTSSVGANAATPPHPYGGPPSYNHDFNVLRHHYASSSSAIQPLSVGGFNAMGQMPIPPPPQHRVHFAPPPPPLLQNSAPASSIPIIVSDDIVSGTKRGGWMSPVRRFFILLATFDFLFVVLIWVITIIVRGNSLKVRKLFYPKPNLNLTQLPLITPSLILPYIRRPSSNKYCDTPSGHPCSIAW